MDEIGIVLVVFLVMFIIVGGISWIVISINKANSDSEKRNISFLQYHIDKHNIIQSKRIDIDGFVTFIVDLESERILLICLKVGSLPKVGEDIYKDDIVSFKDITGVSVSIDDEKVYEKSNANIIGRAVVGGAIAGGAGMIVGGLTSKNRLVSDTSHFYMRIITNDILNPNIIFDYYYNRNDFETRDKLNEMQDIIGLIVDRNNA